MSMGYGAYSRLVDEDHEYYLYAYSSYDLNIDFESYKKAYKDMDGMIFIGKEFFREPIIIRKGKKIPSGKRKWVEKKVYPEVDYVNLLRSGKIIIKNSKRIYQKNKSDIDSMAIKILFKLNKQYEETGEIPQYIHIYC